MREIIASILIAVGLFVLTIWASGMHGLIMFNENRFRETGKIKKACLFVTVP